MRSEKEKIKMKTIKLVNKTQMTSRIDMVKLEQTKVSNESQILIMINQAFLYLLEF